jgi:hypothetical protein
LTLQTIATDIAKRGAHWIWLTAIAAAIPWAGSAARITATTTALPRTATKASTASTSATLAAAVTATTKGLALKVHHRALRIDATWQTIVINTIAVKRIATVTTATTALTWRSWARRIAVIRPWRVSFVAPTVWAATASAIAACITRTWPT